MIKSLVLAVVLNVGVTAAADAATLFSSRLTTEASLSADWQTPSQSGGAEIAAAPGGGRALTFSRTWAGGDLFSRNAAFTSTTGSFTLAFDYLGACGFDSNCGAFVGADGGSPNNGGWILTDTRYSGIPNSLPDTGTWQHVIYTFTGTTTGLFLEDYSGASHGGANAIYFRNFVLTDNPDATPDGTLDFSEVTATAPEPAAWLMMLVGVGAVGAMMRRRAGAEAPAAV
jgi:hypothetical protein